MVSVLRQSVLFGCITFAFVLAIDALLSLVFQSLPLPEHQNAFFVSHSVFHGAVLIFSAVGAMLGFAVIRARLPSRRVTVILAIAFGITTVVAGPGSFMLAGAIGAASWLLLGSMAFALGSGVFRKPWQRPTSS